MRFSKGSTSSNFIKGKEKVTERQHPKRLNLITPWCYNSIMFVISRFNPLKNLTMIASLNSIIFTRIIVILISLWYSSTVTPHLLVRYCSLWLTGLTNLFLVATYDPKMHLSSQGEHAYIRILQSTPFKEPVSTTRQLVSRALIPNVIPHPTSKILSILAHGPHGFILGNHAWPKNTSY